MTNTETIQQKDVYRFLEPASYESEKLKNVQTKKKFFEKINSKQGDEYWYELSRIQRGDGVW